MCVDHGLCVVGECVGACDVWVVMCCVGACDVFVHVDHGL